MNVSPKSFGFRNLGYAPPESVRPSDFGLRISQRGYLLTECLVYIAVLFLLLGAGYLALDRCIDNATVLRRNADDIRAALYAGERWRVDVCGANAEPRLETTNDGEVFRLTTARGERAYRFSDSAVYRRVDQSTWTCLLTNLQSSSIALNSRQKVIAWRWELELRPRVKGAATIGRMRPLFSFTAVPQTSRLK